MHGVFDEFELAGVTGNFRLILLARHALHSALTKKQSS